MAIFITPWLQLIEERVNRQSKVGQIFPMGIWSWDPETPVSVP